jgi:hypothetical protein
MLQRRRTLRLRPLLPENPQREASESCGSADAVVSIPGSWFRISEFNTIEIKTGNLAAPRFVTFCFGRHGASMAPPAVRTACAV